MYDPTITSTRRFFISVTVMLGTFMAVMDISVVNVALPHMMGSFAQDLSSITWVATAYSIAEIIMATMAGWWATLLGRKRLLTISMVIFTAGSILCGSAHSFTEIIIFRIIQGIGGGALIPVALAILRETFPREKQAMAMAIYTMGVVLAPALGPVAGGWLTDHWGWPWIFYINVPVGILALAMGSIFIVDPPSLRRGIKYVDWVGILLLTIGLTGMQVVLERGQEENWFDSHLIIYGTIITVAALLGLVIWSLTQDEPIVDFRLFRNVPFTVGSTIGLVFGIALFGSTFVIPALTQNLLGYPAFEAGLVLMPRAIAIFFLTPFVGKLYRHMDPRLLVLISIVIIYGSFHGLGSLTLNVDFWTFVPILLLMGAGMPFMFVTMTTVSLSTIKPEDSTQASALYTLSRRVGGNIGYALIATIVARNSQIHRADMATHLTSLNSTFSTYLANATGVLTQRGMDSVTAQQAAYGLIDRLVNTQSTVMAYNDVAHLMGWMMLALVPLLLLLPSHKKMDRAHEQMQRQAAAKNGPPPEESLPEPELG